MPVVASYRCTYRVGQNRRIRPRRARRHICVRSAYRHSGRRKPAARVTGPQGSSPQAAPRPPSSRRPAIAPARRSSTLPVFFSMTSGVLAPVIPPAAGGRYALRGDRPEQQRDGIFHLGTGRPTEQAISKRYSSLHLKGPLGMAGLANSMSSAARRPACGWAGVRWTGQTRPDWSASRKTCTGMPFHAPHDCAMEHMVSGLCLYLSPYSAIQLQHNAACPCKLQGVSRGSMEPTRLEAWGVSPKIANRISLPSLEYLPGWQL